MQKPDGVVIDTQGLGKTYKKVTALRSLDLKVPTYQHRLGVMAISARGVLDTSTGKPYVPNSSRGILRL